MDRLWGRDGCKCHVSKSHLQQRWDVHTYCYGLQQFWKVFAQDSFDKCHVRTSYGRGSNAELGEWEQPDVQLPVHVGERVWEHRGKLPVVQHGAGGCEWVLDVLLGRYGLDLSEQRCWERVERAGEA